MFTQHHAASVPNIDRTSLVDPIFLGPTREAAILLQANVEDIARFHHSYIPGKRLSNIELMHVRDIIKSIDHAVQLNKFGCSEAEFLTAKALSIKIYLAIVLRNTTSDEEDIEATAVQLLEVLQQPQQQVSPLTLCATLGSLFWQTMMGAIGACAPRTVLFYKSRLRKIIIPLALKDWDDALNVLQRLFYIPSIFSEPAQRIFSEVVC